MKRSIILSLLFLSFSLLSMAQNRKIENFSLPDATTGKSVSLSDFQNRKAVVVLFTSNSCPYSKLYEERFSALVKSYSASEVAFLMINPNHPQESPEDSMEAMRSKAAALGLDIPYLADQDQKVSQLFGASKTPEVFVLAAKPARFSVVYSGALDNNPQVAREVTQAYLKNALEAVLQGKAVNSPSKRPVGCMIKVKN